MSVSASDILELEASAPVEKAYRKYLNESVNKNHTLAIETSKAESYYFLAMARVLGLSEINFRIEGTVVNRQNDTSDIDCLEAAWMRDRTLNLLKFNPEIRWTAKFMISIVVAHRNRISFLMDLFETLGHQSEKNFEVIVVDDFSSEDVQQQLQDLKKKSWPFSFQIVFLNKRLGARKARNWGSKIANGSHLFFVDDDNLLIPSAIEIAKKAILHSPFNILVCPLYRVFHRPQMNEIANWEEKKSRIWVVPGGGPRSILGNAMGDMGFIIARETYIRLGGLNERTELACEDWAFLLRAERNGFLIGVLPKPLQIYYDHPNSFFKRSPVYLSEISALIEGRGALNESELDSFESHKFSSDIDPFKCILTGALRVFQDEYSLVLPAPTDQHQKTLQFFMGAGHDGVGRLVFSFDSGQEELVFQIKKGTRKYVLASKYKDQVIKAVMFLPKGIYFFRDGLYLNTASN